MTYAEFLKTKEIRAESTGFEPDRANSRLFGWQSDIVRWALRKGRAAIFTDCGLGKTAMQLEWAAQVSRHTGRPVLIVAPLSVAAQTRREGVKFGVPVTVCRGQQDVGPGVNITNYEMVQHFRPEVFTGVVLDESSILKNAAGATRKLLTEQFSRTPYRLCCTATPSPNDYMELGTHSEFLGVMTQSEMLSTFFCHDGGEGRLVVWGGSVVRVKAIYASDIADNKKIRVVFFKENLSTGWDCPRAETMMSFRHAQDATYIAQLLGRMIRTPLQRHDVDETLNEVRLFLPHFNKDNVATVMKISDSNFSCGNLPALKPSRSQWKSVTSNQETAAAAGKNARHCRFAQAYMISFATISAALARM